MAVREVCKIGNPVLREVARDLGAEEVGSGGLHELAADLVDTMRAEGGIGIAAPQIGVSVQVAVIEIDEASDRYPDMQPFVATFFVNPRVTVLDDTEQSFWEGCLSVPDLRGVVSRPRKVRVDYVDLEGNARSIEAEGFLATVLQHELDHLQGVLFIDRVRDTTRLATVSDYQRFWMDRPVEEPI